MKNIEYLQIQCSEDWSNYLDHEFVRQLALGTLPNHCFRHYLQQDYLFLKHYARAFAQGIYKSDSLEQMREILPALRGIIEYESTLHISYCQQYGWKEKHLNGILEDIATVAYTRYILDCGHQRSLIDLFTALAPCGLGYAEIGRRLINHSDTILEGNPYRNWIEMYSGEEFQSGSQTMRTFINQLLLSIPDNSARWEKLIHIFRTATQMEVAFWQQGIDAAE